MNPFLTSVLAVVCLILVVILLSIRNEDTEGQFPVAKFVWYSGFAAAGLGFIFGTIATGLQFA